MKNILTNRITGLYSNLATPHCVVGVSSPVNHGAQPRPYAVFLCVLHGNIVMMGYVGESKGSPVRDTGLLTLHSLSPLFSSSDDGFKPIYHESTIMQNINSASVRPFILICSFEVPTSELNPDFIPSITVVFGQYEKKEEVIAARNAINSPALIAASCQYSLVNDGGAE